MIGTTVSHYLIVEKLGEVPNSLLTLFVGIANLRTPTSFVGGYMRRHR